MKTGTILSELASAAPVIVMIGTDHTRAPLALRERLALDGKAVTQLLQELHADDAVVEAALLCTCNRTEAYLVATNPAAAEALVRQAFAELLEDHAEPLDELLIVRRGPEAVRHLCAVASGLESLVVAESQILGQVRSAIEQAQRAGTSGLHLAAVFRAAVACGKRVRSETAIGRTDVSAGSVLIDLISERGIDWPSQRVLLIGAGRMNSVTAERMRALGVRDIRVTSRTHEAATTLASAVDGCAIPMSGIAEAARAATIIVTATRSPGLMVTAGMLQHRAASPVVVVDLAVPRDVDPAASTLPGVTLLDIDHVLDRRDRRGLSEALRDAAQMVDGATAEWQAWCRTREAVPLIADLRAHVDRQREAEVTRAFAHLAHLPDEDRAVVEEMAHRLVNKMFHHLATRMKKAVADPVQGEQHLESARVLLKPDEHPRSFEPAGSEAQPDVAPSAPQTR